MPLDYCHPTAPHKKIRMPDWYVSGLMMDRALDAVMRRVKNFDRKHDIPYLAGYSLDGKTIYIDRHMPQAFKFRGRTVETHRFLILHEEVEKTLIDQLACTICTLIRSRPAPRRPPCAPPASNGGTTIASCRSMSKPSATNALAKFRGISTLNLTA